MLLVFLWYCEGRSCSAVPGAVAVLELKRGKGLSLIKELGAGKVGRGWEYSRILGIVIQLKM